MTTGYTGSGDPTASMALLWRVPGRPRRGPRPRLSVEAITRAAIDLADAEGLGALSMRGVADRLGIPVMSLYTYLPGKAELLDLMLDAVYGESVADRAPDGTTAGWRDRLERVARTNLEMCRRHPWMLYVVTYRPPLGPNLIAKYDAELAAVEGLGLSDVEMDSVLTLLLGFVNSAARGAVEAQAAPSRTGMTDEQWWQANAPLLAQAVDATRYPLASRVGSAAGAAYGGANDPGHAFEFGLRCLLDGVAALVRARSAPAG